MSISTSALKPAIWLAASSFSLAAAASFTIGVELYSRFNAPVDSLTAEAIVNKTCRKNDGLFSYKRNLLNPLTFDVKCKDGASFNEVVTKWEKVNTDATAFRSFRNTD